MPAGYRFPRRALESQPGLPMGHPTEATYRFLQFCIPYGIQHQSLLILPMSCPETYPVNAIICFCQPTDRAPNGTSLATYIDMALV